MVKKTASTKELFENKTSGPGAPVIDKIMYVRKLAPSENPKRVCVQYETNAGGIGYTSLHKYRHRYAVTEIKTNQGYYAFQMGPFELRFRKLIDAQNVFNELASTKIDMVADLAELNKKQ